MYDTSAKSEGKCPKCNQDLGISGSCNSCAAGNSVLLICPDAINIRRHRLPDGSINTYAEINPRKVGRIYNLAYDDSDAKTAARSDRK